jgi:stage V sporulation protein B
LEETTAKKSKGVSFMKNVLLLMLSEIVVKVLGLVYRLVITNIEGFGDAGLGYYSSGYQIYALLLTLCSIGIPSVISKLVSERLAVGNNYGAQRIFKTALKLFTGIGLVLSLGLFFGADLIATKILNVPDVAYVLRVLAPAIVFVAMSAVFRGYFSGQQNMKPTSVTQILEQFLNCVLTILFVYALVGKEPYIMAAGGNLSTTLSIIITFLYLITYYKNNKVEVDKNQDISEEAKKTNREIAKTILALSIPVTIGSVISVISSVIDTATVSNCIQQAFSSLVTGGKEVLEQIAMEKTGILSKVDNLTNLPIAINLAFSTALVPAISESIAKKEYNVASKRLSFSILASIIIIIPCAIGYICLSDQILNLIYPNAPDGGIVLKLSSIAMIFVALSQTINGGLYGINKPLIPALALAIGAVIKLVLNLILVSNPSINILGAPISSIICQIIAFIICYKALTRKIKLKIPPIRYIIKPLLAGIIMGVSVYFINMGLNMIMSGIISTLISIFAGAIIYVAMIFILRILTKEEISMIPFGSKLLSKLNKEEKA